MWLGILVLSFAGVQFTGAQPNPSSPNPSPTNAVQKRERKLRVEVRASEGSGQDGRYALLMRAYSKLLRAGLNEGILSPYWRPAPTRLSHFQINSSQPAPEIISWLTRSQVVKQRKVVKETFLALESPEIGTLVSVQPHLRAMKTQDLNSDGVADMLALGYDGKLYFLESPRAGGPTVVSRSPSLAALEWFDGPSTERLRTDIPMAISSVDFVDEKHVRVLLQHEILEMADQKLLGRAIEQREHLFPLDQLTDKIRVDLDDPQDYQLVSDEHTQINGRVISEKLLGSVKLFHNGKQAWSMPSGLGTRALRLEMSRKLEPGWNSLRFFVSDRQGSRRERQVWLERPALSASATPRKKRAIIVSRKAFGPRLNQALAKSGFLPAEVSVLNNSEHSKRALLEALQDSRGCEELLLYCEASSHPDQLVNGKALGFTDGLLGVDELRKSLESGAYRKTFAIFHTSPQKKQRRTRGQKTNPWRDATEFAQALSKPGRIILTNLDQNKSRTSRRSYRQLLIKSLESTRESDLERALPHASTPSVFRGWMFGSAVLSP